MTAATLEPTRAEAFADRMMDTLNHAAAALMISVGHRTGLFDAMSDMTPSTPKAIARRTGLSERYIREWLGAMYTARVVEHDPTQGTYTLPTEHAAWLTRAAGSNNLAASTQWIGLLGAAENDVVEAFVHGKGVPYSAYSRFHEVMAEESQQTVVAALREHILPLVPGLSQKLIEGLDVLDVGCGAGRALIRLAESFPSSRFTGYDFSEEAIQTAREDAQKKGLSNVRFVVQDAAAFTDAEAYDLVLTFDAIHDQARPETVLDNIRRALRPGGVYLCQDIKAHSRHHGNEDHPAGPFIYTVSCMHCMSVSLANGGPGLGAAWGKQVAMRMFYNAGFRNIRVDELEHDFLNNYYTMTK